MSTSVQYASYLIRLWQESKPDRGYQRDWLSEVEHIQTGRRWKFSSLDDLLTFLRRQAEGPHLPPLPRS